jgi:peptidoglycan/LPS O-acetylase OafA/YrhL
MFVCSLLVWLTSGLFSERPRGEIHIWDLLPGLTFIGDGSFVHLIWDHLGNVLGIKIESIEGAFWSLYVEARFYIVFGLAYFILSERAGIAILLLLFSLGKLGSPTLLHLHFGAWNIGETFFTPIQHALATIRIESVVNYAKSYGFFAAGALFFLFYATRNPKYYWSAVVVGIISCGTGADLALTLLFALAIASVPIQSLLSNRALVFVGFISYPLYLIHENMMVAMIVKIGRVFPSLFAILIPTIPILVVGGSAWIIASYLEPAAKKVLAVRAH